METLETTAAQWSADLRKDLIKEYDRLRFRASGRYAAELRDEVTSTGASVRVKITAPAYAYFMEQGRGANSKQRPEDLKKWVSWAGSTFLAQWVRDKGIDASPFAVAWKIARRGYSVANRKGVVSNVVTPERIALLTKEIANVSISGIKSEIIDKWRSL